MSAPQPTLTEPLEDSERVVFLDVLRGFAVLGLVLVKAADFSPDFWMEWPSSLDRAISWFEEHFLADKFWTLFAFLFGLGFAIQMQRATARGASFPRFYVRRSLVLLAIGLAHGLLIWSGDIVAGYALISFVLLLFRNASVRTILLSAALVWMIGHGVWFIRQEILQLPRPVPVDTSAITTLLSSGPPLEIMRYQAMDTLIYLRRGVVGPGMWMSGILTVFLLGLYAARRGVVRRLAGDAAFCRRILLVALVVAAVAWPAQRVLAEVWPAGWFRVFRRMAFSGLWQLQTWGMSATYASLLALLAMRHGWAERLAPLAAVGRTALSNYVLQSVVFVLLYYNYGMGLYGRVRPSVAMLISLGVAAGTLALSAWWVRRYRFGPVEWLWRSLTYGRRQPMRRAGEPAEKPVRTRRAPQKGHPFFR